MHRRLSVLCLLGVVMASLAVPALAAKKPDATVSLTEGSVAAGIGWSWGHGVLHYMGKTYKFKVDGLSVGEVGMTDAKATGKVYGLKKLADFDGVYAAGGAGATAGKGAGVSALVNANGVSLTLTSSTKGASLKIAAEGLKVKLEQ